MWTSFKRWRRAEASANNVSNKKSTTNYRREKGTKLWCWPWSRPNNLPLAFRPIQPDLDDKSHKLGLLFWSDEGKAANLFNLLPSDILFEEILVRIVPTFMCDLGTFRIDVDGETHFLNERLYASYFLGMILFESRTTRGESKSCFVAKGHCPYSESFIYFRRNARRLFLKLGIDRPLRRVEIRCSFGFCECQRMKEGYALDQLASDLFVGMTCSSSYHYELLRIASVAAFSEENELALVMWRSFKQKLKCWRRGEGSANNVSNKKTSTNRRGKGSKGSIANNLLVASRPNDEPELDDKSHNLGLVYWSDEGKEASLFNLLPSDILFEEILARIVIEDELGPKTLCRLSCVCKFFYDASNEAETLKKVKISFSKNVKFEPICYENFVCKCATVGNLRAIAALEVLGNFHIDEDGESHYLNLVMILNVLYASTLIEIITCLWLPVFIIFTIFTVAIEGNGRSFLLKLGIDRPLRRAEIPCNFGFCECQRMKEGYALDQLEFDLFVGMTCSLSYHYELFRIASVAAFSGKNEE
ncbi:hypothetical protein CCACVL1_10124 [Corchorus capsularis]|uniref:F-box domain-containing protein n=1 Tax=Corchorus capsularis TaxID=210143 RepID=A0A1R3ISH9_COCAP|nr:hypothetical protein CCACVL1_10124 [Corchorus capsularis]